jgi:triosephosphate isomerase
MTPVVVGNWKMNETATQADALARTLVTFLGNDPKRVRVVIAPPFTALTAVRDALRGSDVELGAQNLYWEDRGAFTGEVSAPMLVDLGVHYAIVGHSERRRYFGETDDDVRRKMAAALAHGLSPIVAVGETQEERDSGLTDERVRTQTNAAIASLDAAALERIAIAYEPVWAIGTGQSCEPHEAERVMQLIRSCLPGGVDVPLLYGGSVNPANFANYVALEHCNGGLVGGASLDPRAFAALVRIAATAAA